MERTLAAIMARFEHMWTAFVAARGSFAPFMDLYLDHWLEDVRNSDDTTSPQSRVPPPPQDPVCTHLL